MIINLTNLSEINFLLFLTAFPFIRGRHSELLFYILPYSLYLLL